MSKTPFLDKLEQAEKTSSGIFLNKGFLPPEDATKAFELLNDDTKFPWDLKPKLYGQKIPQHAYTYRRSKREYNKSEGLSHLETICKKIEKEYDGKVDTVFCNRFQDPAHHIQWHTDTFGRHIMVLSLGSQRAVQFRNKKTKEDVEDIIPDSGGLYFMPLQINKTHEHQVQSSAYNPGGCLDTAGTRLSFVFFFDTPRYAKDYKITFGDRMKGFLEDVSAGG